MHIRGRITDITLAAALAFPAAVQGMETEAGDEGLVAMVVKDAAADRSEERDTCFHVTEAYRRAVEENYPVPPRFEPKSCTTGSGLKVVMTCSPAGQWLERVKGTISSVVTDDRSGKTAEYACRTGRVGKDSPSVSVP